MSSMAHVKVKPINLSELRKVFLTSEGYESLKLELKTLEGKKPELSRKIGMTAAFGDLPENHAWDAAKEEEAFLNGREIKAILRNVEILKPQNSDSVILGSKVTLESERTQTQLTVVDPLESNLSLGKVSPDSLFGKLLMGKKVGEEFTLESPLGQVVYRVLKVA